MRIALLHPTYAPEVRRGSERLVSDLAAALAGIGHEVTVITGHPGRTVSRLEDGVRVVRGRRFSQPPTFGLHEEFLGNAPNVLRRLGRGGYDVAQAFYLTDAWAALRARRLEGPPVVFSFHGIPDRPYLVARRRRLEMFQRVVGEAAECSVLSEAAAAPFRRYLLREPRILPGGVVGERFAVDEPRAASPTLLCAASLGDPRKRGRLLLSAFARLRERRPDAVLKVVRAPDPFLSPYSLELPEGAEWIEAPSDEELARAYAGAWASVLPAVDEPFGLVLIESLAAGTPVVAARSGACPEILGDDEWIGRQFEPDDAADLVRAMDEALELKTRSGTAGACRERALPHDWSRVVRSYETVLRSAGGGSD